MEKLKNKIVKRRAVVLQKIKDHKWNDGVKSDYAIGRMNNLLTALSVYNEVLNYINQLNNK